MKKSSIALIFLLNSISMYASNKTNQKAVVGSPAKDSKVAAALAAKMADADARLADVNARRKSQEEDRKRMMAKEDEADAKLLHAEMQNLSCTEYPQFPKNFGQEIPVTTNDLGTLIVNGYQYGVGNRFRHGEIVAVWRGKKDDPNRKCTVGVVHKTKHRATAILVDNEGSFKIELPENIGQKIGT